MGLQSHMSLTLLTQQNKTLFQISTLFKFTTALLRPTPTRSPSSAESQQEHWLILLVKCVVQVCVCVMKAGQ